MITKVMNSISRVFGDSQFSTYLESVQAHDAADAPTAQQALHDYMDAIRCRATTPW